MIWALLATIGIFVVSNLPVAYAAWRFDWATFTGLWKLAPHQFFFSVFCVPLAVWLCCIALWWTLKASKGPGLTIPAPWNSVIDNWPVVFLLGIALAAVVGAAFFLSTTWSPDKLRNDYPQKTVLTIDEINRTFAATVDEDARKALEHKKAVASDELTQAKVTSSNVDSRYANLTEYQRAAAALNKTSQQSLRLTDDAAIALSAFQVLAVVGVGAVLLLTCGLLFLVGSHSQSGVAQTEMIQARLAALLAIAAFVPYPYLFGLYRTELERSVRDPGTGGQEIVALAAILVAAFIVTVSTPTPDLTSLPAIVAACVALFAVLGTVISRLDGGPAQLLRQYVGFESTLGAQVTLVVVGSVVSVVMIAATWPRT